MIRTIRGTRVMLDRDLARIYGVPTKVFNQAVKRNRQRFPEDFMFRLTREEATDYQASWSQIVTLKRGQNIKYLPSFKVQWVFPPYSTRQSLRCILQGV
jgi:ORF6N domain